MSMSFNDKELCKPIGYYSTKIIPKILLVGTLRPDTNQKFPSYTKTQNVIFHIGHSLLVGSFKLRSKSTIATEWLVLG